MSRRLQLVPAAPSAHAAAAAEHDVEDAYVTVPVPRRSGAAQDGSWQDGPWQGDAEVSWVPAVLLLAASGRCSCDDCCAALARRQRRTVLGAAG